MWKKYCTENIPVINRALDRYLPQGEYPSLLFEAMRYSLFAGGKRLRPILLMAAADAVGGNGQDFLPVACGLEMIHTYSLIHDDLPAMDNDDYRRGKLTNHKVFGEATAILAGDGLLTVAFEIMLGQKNVSPALLLEVVREMAISAGASGMVGGQTIDLMSEGKQLDLNSLQQMHRAKTGALFKAALRCGGLLGAGSAQQVDSLVLFAENYGLAFQIIDDVLDVIGNQDDLGKPIGSDEKNQKATYVSLFSLAQAQKMAQDSVNKAIISIEEFDNSADILRSLAHQLLVRNS